MATKKSALGKGLGALLDNTGKTAVPTQPVNNTTAGVNEIPINQIEANAFQPRTHFEQEALEELSSSIKEHGIIQPITIRKIGHQRFQIISGERRYRAAKMAGLEKVPVYIREADDQTMLEMAIVENIQRQDLNALEIAISYQRLIDECNITQEKVGERVGKSRASVTNYLRLLNLPTEIQAAIRDKAISMGHAKALLSFDSDDEKLKAFKQIIEQKLSVRAVEELAKNKKTTSLKSNKKNTLSLSREEKRLQEDLSFHFGTKVKIAKKDNGKGVISIPFKDQKHLEKILALLDQ